MPLIEAFLAFALTMLALATAISAIVGVWLRFFRWRAFGFRQSMEAIYDIQIEPRLTASQPQMPSASDRLGFIADMTFGLSAQAGAVTGDVRAQRIAELKKCRELPSDKHRLVNWLRFVQRSFRRWHSLRFGVDYLTESQFQLRLNGSTAGKALAARHGSDDWQRLSKQITKSFTEIGVSATEAFSRRARVRTVIAGLVLAFAVNIDSFNLLNTYLTNDEIRRDVLAQQDRILEMQVSTQPGSPDFSLALGEYAARTETALGQIQSSIAEIGSVKNLGQSDKQKIAELEQALEGVREDLTIVNEATGELNDALSQTRGIAASLANSFPIGWDGYPNCEAATDDLRCARMDSNRVRQCHEVNGSDKQNIDVACADTAGFVKWLFGVLLTGFMVGLGAPFWVQTVNRVLKLKEDITGAKSAQ